MDFAAIGESLAMAKVMRNATQTTQDWIDWSQRQVSVAKVERRATEAGRMAQVLALRDALAAVAPNHDLLQATGLIYDSGNPEMRWHRLFERPYDAIAIENQIPVSSKPTTPAEAARRKVLAEPVEIRRVFFCRTYWWRGEQHRSEAGAQRARAAEAEMAARGVKP